ncbi:MAG: cytochrome c oxidase subunit 3 [Pyrinomonadaceae bacterium]
MATTVTSTRSATKKDTRVGGGPKPPGPNGRGPRGNGWRGGQDDKRGKLSPAAYRITIWVVLAAVVMMFAALSGAYIFLSAGGQGVRVAMPRMFFLSTGLILLSSLSFESAKRSLKQGGMTSYVRLIAITLILGLLFLGAQLMGWRELAAQGIYFASHPHSSFFYFLTGFHGVHLLGGILALLYLVARTRRHREKVALEKSVTVTEVVSLYWHTMDGLWLWILLLLLIWG